MDIRKRHRQVSCTIAFLICVSVNSSLCIPAAADSKSRAAEQENIWEAVFRYQFKQHSGVLCLSIPGKTSDPSDSFMSRFKDISPPVKKFSQFQRAKSHDSQRWFSDPKTGQPMTVLSVGKITWISDDHVQVKGGYYCGSLCAGGGIFDVVRQRGVWVVSKFNLKFIS